MGRVFPRRGRVPHLTKKIDFRNPGEGFILKFFKWENPGEEKKGEGFSNYYTGFLGVNRNGISASAIIEKLKNGHHFINIDHTEKFQVTDPQKLGSPFFRVLTEMEYQHRPL